VELLHKLTDTEISKTAFKNFATLLLSRQQVLEALEKEQVLSFNDIQTVKDKLENAEFDGALSHQDVAKVTETITKLFSNKKPQDDEDSQEDQDNIDASSDMNKGNDVPMDDSDKELEKNDGKKKKKMNKKKKKQGKKRTREISSPEKQRHKKKKRKESSPEELQAIVVYLKKDSKNSPRRLVWCSNVSCPNLHCAHWNTVWCIQITI